MTGLAETQQGWLPLYLEFTRHMKIPSKELVGADKVSLSEVRYSSQRRFLEAVCRGLDAGVHDFKFLKARQLGISSESLALDVFWLSVHDQIQGALITDDESNREKFRVLIEHYVASLPRQLRVGIRRHNRHLLELNNGSVLDYLVAGKRRSNTTLGQGRALNFVHATEVGSYGSDEGIASVKASLAQKHPHRLYIWESTAHGHNWWHDMWIEAKDDVLTQRAEFIGWWSKEDYAFAEDTPQFRHYWDYRLDDEEIRLCQEVEKRYGWKISPGQIAWHRWYRTTQMTSPELMNQNYPWTEDEAFIHSGTSFFPLFRVAADIKFIKETQAPFKGYRYHMGQDFLATEIEQVNKVLDAELRIWEEPVPNAVYAMGVDPAYGRSETKDNHAVEVVRCYADKIVQVAEYATHNPETYQLTWVMAHLAGAYKNVCINCEVFGPGKAIMVELRHLKQLMEYGYLQNKATNAGMQEIFDCVRWYLYHRPDSMAGNMVYNFQTTMDSKLTMLNQLRDNYSLGMLRVRSIALLREMENIVQDGSEIAASGKRHKDDRTFAMGLANKAFIDRLRPSLIAEGQTYEAVEKAERLRLDQPQATMVQHIVASFFKSQEDSREADAVAKSWRDAGVVT